jgi:uncharacterized membrane protein
VATNNTISVDQPFTHKDIDNQPLSESSYAFIAPWETMDNARFLGDLIQSGIRVRFSEKDFTVGGNAFSKGSLIITRGDNRNLANFNEILRNVANKHEVSLTPSATGFVDKGADFGAASVPMVMDKKIAVLKGGPTSSLDFGEVWHFFEQQLNYPITVINADYFDRVNLKDYDVLILPDGRYSSFSSDSRKSSLKEFTRAGGKIIAMGGALSLFSQGGFSLKEKDFESKESVLNVHANGAREGIKNYITGAIFKTTLDLTHPLAFGYKKDYFSLKLGADAYETLDIGTVASLENSKPVSGFAGSNTLEKMKNTLVFGVDNQGRGSVIYMVDNPLFRGFWENGKLFFANALFLVQ